MTEVNAVNATAAALLGLLHDGPMTGGELVAPAGERFGAFFSVTRSQVYRELPALADAGLLASGEQGPRASRRYQLTPSGKRAFKTWLTSGEGGDQLRSSLILRLRHAGSLTARQRRVLVDQGRETYLERLARAQDEAKLVSSSSGTGGDPYARAVAEFTVAHNRAVLALLDAVPTG